MSISLRDYQQTLVDEIRNSFRRHRRVVAVAPTGAGKTHVFSYITTNAAAKRKRVIIAAHRDSIVDQISGALTAMGVRHGRIQPGHTFTDDPVQVAMVMTLANRLDKIQEPDLFVIDECHHAVSGSYKRITDAWERARILGVTATPRRTDGRGLEESFDDLVIGPEMADLITRGFLAPYTYLAPPTQVDLSSVKTARGDFAIDQLAEAVDRATITGDTIKTYRQHLNGRPAIAFCCNVAHAEHVAEQYRNAGYQAASVDGKMSKPDIKRRLEAIGNGGLNVLTSCDLISEGTDIPAVSGAILLRPTQSIIQFLQSVGRVLRVKPDGSGAIINDHVGNVNRHGMPDALRTWTLAGKEKQPTGGISTCEQCFRAFETKPGWRAEEECAQGQPEGCILNAPEERAPKEGLEVVEGELVAVTNIPAWSGGVNIATARGADFAKMIRQADSIDKLKEIAKARGYHHGWVKHTWGERRKQEAA